MMFYWFAGQCGLLRVAACAWHTPIPIRCFVFALDFDVGRVDPSSAGLSAGEPFPPWIARFCDSQRRWLRYFLR